MSSSPAEPTDYQKHAALLLGLARASIEHGLAHGKPVPVDLSQFPAELRDDGASFVTLYRHHELRGCIGSLEPHQPLVEDIADNAFNAAFRDPRFPRLSRNELRDLELHISILTPISPLPCTSEEDLIAKLQPGRDGLVIEDGVHRGTFLPAVWESLADPRAFLRHLKQKAGLPQDYWSDSIRVYRYETISLQEN